MTVSLLIDPKGSSWKFKINFNLKLARTHRPVVKHEYTLPTAEILSGKNARAFLVCGFLMKSFKENILKIRKKSWEPYGSYLLNVLFSR